MTPDLSARRVHRGGRFLCEPACFATRSRSRGFGAWLGLFSARCGCVFSRRPDLIPRRCPRSPPRPVHPGRCFSGLNRYPRSKPVWIVRFGRLGTVKLLSARHCHQADRLVARVQQTLQRKSDEPQDIALSKASTASVNADELEFSFFDHNDRVCPLGLYESCPGARCNCYQSNLER